MTTLSFNIEALQELAEHTKQATEHSMPYGYTEEGKKPEAGFFLVKDHGIYLMSNGNPGLKAEPDNPDSHRQKVVFANGYNPDEGDVYDKCVAAVGGDDFAEFIPLNWLGLTEQNRPNAKVMKIKFTATSMELVY